MHPAAENEAAGREIAPGPEALTHESALAALCGRLIEGCWLVAAGVLPLLMDPLAVHRFQPIKMGVLNSLGLISMLALAVRLADGGFRRHARIPAWLAAAMMLVLSFLASTALSVSVGDSLWGGDPFLQGSFALFCQLGLFAGVAVCLRDREQWDRLIAMMLSASLPLALFVIYQRFGWDPSSPGSSVLQFDSFGGHPAFTAGTLLIMIPLCGWKLFSALGSARDTGRTRSLTAASFYGILLTIQVLAVIATGKRGPFLGLLAAAAAAAVLHAVCGNRVRSALAAVALTAAAMLVLTGLALLARENPKLRQMPVIERLAMIVPVGEGTGDAYRENLWKKAPAILLTGGTKSIPDRETDPWWRIRLLVGYGPESTLTRLLHNKAPSHLILMLLLPAWLAANLLLLANSRSPLKGAPFRRTLTVSCIVSLGISAGWAVWKAGQIAALGPLPQASTPLDVMTRQAVILENLAVGFFLLVVMIPVAAAVFSSCRRSGSRRPRAAMPALLVAAGGTTLCVGAIRFTQVPVLLNEAVADYARGLGSMNLVPATAEFYQRAAGHVPRDLNNRIQGTKALVGVAEKSTDTQEYLGILRKAEAFLQSGLKHNDRNVLNYYHANVLMRQAFEMPVGAERESTAQRARAAYAAALRYAPNTEVAWFERSLVERELLGDKAAADASLARADEIAETVDPVIFGDQYAYQMQTTVSPALNPAYGKRGVEYYTRALEAPGGLPPAEQARLRVAKGTLLVNLRQPAAAGECLLVATRQGETPDLWRAHAMLAELSLKAGDHAAARLHLDEAIRRAPDRSKPGLQQLRALLSR